MKLLNLPLEAPVGCRILGRHADGSVGGYIYLIGAGIRARCPAARAANKGALRLAAERIVKQGSGFHLLGDKKLSDQSEQENDHASKRLFAIR